VDSSANHIKTEFDFLEDFTLREEAIKILENRIHQAPIDIRNALQTYTSTADTHQQKVIEAKEGTIRVVAPAGSGKTQTLINRVLNSIKNGLNPTRILILTFDNSAASSLRLKLQEQTTKLPTTTLNISITTLNAFGYQILRLYVPKEYKKIIPFYRQRSIFKETLTDLENKSTKHYQLLPKNIKDRYYLEYFSLLKNELFDPREVDGQKLADFILKAPSSIPYFQNAAQLNLNSEDNTKIIIQSIVWLFQTYNKKMYELNLIDFDDQKLLPYLNMQKSKDLRESLQSSYAEILVDEFQDINTLDFSFIKLLARNATLLVTGDDDQAIYGFRGCTPDYIIDLETHLGRAIKSYELQVNYRSPENIIAHAKCLIEKNTRRISKNPIANNKQNSEIKVLSTLSAGLESKLIISLIKKIKNKNNSIKYSDFSILYRTNAQSLPFQIELILNDIPYFVREQDNILTNEILEKLLGVLKLQLNLKANKRPPTRDIILTIKSYFRYINSNEALKLETLFNSNPDFFSTIASEEIFNIIPKIRKSNFKRSIEELLLSNSLLKTLDIISQKFKGLYGMFGSLEDMINEQVPLGEIYEIAINFKGSTKDFVNAIITALNKAQITQAGKHVDGVALLTYFKSKGLQWHTVFLSSCNEGLIPHKRANIEDERRLFYVALTRASSNLIISYVKKTCNNLVSPSRFLYEAELMKI